jgi:folate-dependent phosphoribosylglycinamide formyltransferase PurN
MTSRSRPLLRLGWFSTGRGEGSRGLLQAVLDAIDSSWLRARIEFVFCNREKGQAEGSDRFLALVESRAIPLVAFSSQRFRKERGGRPWAELREEYDRAAIELLKPFHPDVVVNAGYMLIAPLLCRAYRMVNLHPALPGGPKGTWQQVIWELIASEAAESGAMVHVVTEAVDEGPVISFCRFSLRGPGADTLWQEVEGKPVADLMKSPGEELPLFRAIREAGLARERPLLVETLRAVADGEVDLTEAGSAPAVDLTAEVERAVAEGGTSPSP